VGELFSTSLAKDSNRLTRADIGSADDAQRLLEQAKNDPAASRSLLDKILGLAGDENISDAEKQELLGAAAAAAVQASDIGGLILGAASSLDVQSLGSGSGEPEDYAKLIQDLLDAAESRDVAGISDEMAGAFAGSYDPDGTLSDEVLAGMGKTPQEQDTNLGLLALSLLLGQLEPDADITKYAGDDNSFAEDPAGAMGEIFRGLETDGADSVSDIIEINPSLKLLDATIGSIGKDGHEVTDPIAKQLGAFWNSLKGVAS
jgi:hypothetical protein